MLLLIAFLVLAYCMVGVHIIRATMHTVYNYAHHDPAFARLVRDDRSGSWMIALPKLAILLLWPLALVALALMRLTERERPALG